MPRKHSSMGLLKPTMSERLTGTQMLKNNLEQEDAVLRDVQEFIDLNVNRQYIQEFQGDLTSQLSVQDFDAQNGAAIEAKLQNWAGFSQQLAVTSTIQMISSFALSTVANARQGFALKTINDDQTIEINSLKTELTTLTVQLEDAGIIAAKKYEAPIMCDIKANVNLDIRYLFYIKEHGPPENGVFDPVKLAKYVFVDTSGNTIGDQDHFQYGAFGHSNEATIPDASDITNLFQGHHINTGNTF
jgi:hypothetical protein